MSRPTRTRCCRHDSNLSSRPQSAGDLLPEGSTPLLAERLSVHPTRDAPLARARRGDPRPGAAPARARSAANQARATSRAPRRSPRLPRPRTAARSCARRSRSSRPTTTRTRSPSSRAATRSPTAANCTRRCWRRSTSVASQPDYYARNPRRGDDAGYLEEIVDACRCALSGLPSRASIALTGAQARHAGSSPTRASTSASPRAATVTSKRWAAARNATGDGPEMVGDGRVGRLVAWPVRADRGGRAARPAAGGSRRDRARLLALGRRAALAARQSRGQAGRRGRRPALPAASTDGSRGVLADGEAGLRAGHRNARAGGQAEHGRVRRATYREPAAAPPPRARGFPRKVRRGRAPGQPGGDQSRLQTDAVPSRKERGH
jgi:hypothetical protein